MRYPQQPPWNKWFERSPYFISYSHNKITMIIPKWKVPKWGSCISYLLNYSAVFRCSTFFYKWNVFKKFKNALEACFYKHCFYIFIITLGENKIIECLVPVWKLFIKRQTSGTLYRRVTTGDGQWQQMTMRDNEWQRVVQPMTTSGTMSDNEWKRMVMNENEWRRLARSDNNWQRVTASDNEWYNEWKWIRTSKIGWFYRFQNQTKCQSGSWIILFNFSCNI